MQEAILNNDIQSDFNDLPLIEPAFPNVEKYHEDLRGQYVRVPMAIMLDLKAGELTYRDVCLYLYLLAKQGQKNSLWWSVESLSRLTGIDSGGIKGSIAKLLKCKHIQRKKTKLTTHTFCMTLVRSDAMETCIFIKGAKAFTRPAKQPVSQSTPATTPLGVS